MDKLDAMTKQVRDFCDARDWRKYHTPKELAIGMATEPSELLQLFRFVSDERIAEMLKTPSNAKLSKTKSPTRFFSFCVSQI